MTDNWTERRVCGLSEDPFVRLGYLEAAVEAYLNGKTTRAQLRDALTKVRGGSPDVHS